MTDRLKIGFVLDDRLDKPDGVQAYVKTIGGWLESQGHEVHYIVGASPSLSNQKNVHSLSRTLEVKFNKNRMGTPLPANKDKIKKLLCRLDLDILHVQMPYSPFMAGKIIKYASSKTAVFGTFHILPYSWVEKSATKTLSRILRSSLRRFDYIFSVSQAASSFAQSHFGVESSVLPNVVDISAFKVASRMAPAGRMKIVFLGRLVKRKGVLELLDAYQSMLSSNPEFAKSTELIIGGTGELLDKVSAQAKQIMKTFPGSKVSVSGFINDTDKPAFLGQATLAVFPSTGGESFGIVLLEAMASGSEVVLGGNNPGYVSVIGGINGSIVDPNDVIGFANSLQGLLKSPRMRKQISLEQQSLVGSFNVDLVGKKLVETYKAVASQLQNNHNV